MLHNFLSSCYLFKQRAANEKFELIVGKKQRMIYGFDVHD